MVDEANDNNEHINNYGPPIEEQINFRDNEKYYIVDYIKTDIMSITDMKLKQFIKAMIGYKYDEQKSESENGNLIDDLFEEKVILFGQCLIIHTNDFDNKRL